MKFINFVAILLVLLFFHSCKKPPSIESVPEYKLIKDFSRRILSETQLVLCCYGVNNSLPEGYHLKNGLANFSADYYLFKTQNDSISLDEARSLTVSLVESFLSEINSNPAVRADLDIYPMTSDQVRISINIVDENKVDIGKGIAKTYFSRGKITYDRYEIYEYTGTYPAKGKTHLVHEESYADALEIVKEEGQLTNF
jgi:hypothetical protein